MGAETSTSESTDFLEKLHFVQILQDDNFGAVQVFRNRQPPYEYIMNFQKTFLQKDAAFTSYLQLMQQLKEKAHRNLARLHLVTHVEENHMCIKNVKLCAYFNYYNFTLARSLEKKRNASGQFNEAEIWYVMMCLLEVGRFLKANGIAFGDYMSRNIFLTPEGYVKLYLTGAYPDNKHNAYFSVLASRQELDQHLLSPQQLMGINLSEYQPQFDLYKSDIFSIGMVALELLFLDDPKYYYNADTCEVNFGRVRYQLASLKGEYSHELQALLAMCLEEDPKNRADFDSAVQYIEKVRRHLSVAGSVKLMEDQEDTTLKKKKSMDVRRKLGEGPGLRNLPMNIDQRLVITPIRSYADRRQEPATKKLSINSNSLESSAASSTLSHKSTSEKV